MRSVRTSRRDHAVLFVVVTISWGFILLAGFVGSLGLALALVSVAMVAFLGFSLYRWLVFAPRDTFPRGGRRTGS